MIIHMVQELTSLGAIAGHWGDVLQTLHWPLPDDWMVLAQQFKEPDFAGDIGKAWAHFVKTGQVWAFLIGLVIGYMVKTFTTYG
ncbi:hypothetical protein ACKFKG_24785 [Phormidesmis sp. 146-35]